MNSNPSKFELFRQAWHSKPMVERVELLNNMSKGQLQWLYQNPQVFLFDKQIPPLTPWRYHLYRGARGAGKTFASTSWLYEKIINGAREVAIVGPSYGDLIKEILPIFESHFLPHLRPKFNTKDNLYRCYNGCIVKVYSSDTEIRGMNAEYAIAEEICKWCDEIPDKIQQAFDVFDFGVRSKRAKPCPQIFIASTPKPFPFFINFQKEINNNNPLYSQTLAKTDENVYLSDSAKQAFHNKYDGTRIGRQELYGDLLTDNPNALWTEAVLNKCRLPVPHFNTMIEKNLIRMQRTVIALDVAVSTNPDSDETGLFVGSLGSDNKVYLVQDASGKMTPDQWASKAVELYKKTQAACIVMESNQGGNLLESAIHNIDRYVKTKLIHASVGKATRFEPVVMAYERGEVIHVGDMHQLENQMLTYNPYANNSFSPDRVDAAAYAVYELLLNQVKSPPRNLRSLGSW